MGRFVVQSKRTRNLVTDQRETPQILDDGGGIDFRQPGVGAPRHYGRENVSVVSNSCSDGRREMRLAEELLGMVTVIAIQ